MVTQKLFKRRVRERMSKTGERYATARHHLAQRRARARAVAAAPDLASAIELASDAKLHGATGRHWLEWIAILDEWGARGHKHGEIVEYLSREHAVPPWWRQAVTNGYERATGMRKKHQQPDGFTIYASKTVGVPIDVLFDAFTGEPTRRRWLTDGSMSLRNVRSGKVARFDWADGTTRVEVTFEAKGPEKATAFVAHTRLADADSAEAAKAAWKRRLTALKTFLESSPSSA
jgi:hypothetical protein